MTTTYDTQASEQFEDSEDGLGRWFPLFSGARYPDMDLLAIVVQCMEEMDDQQRQCALGYMNARFRP